MDIGIIYIMTNKLSGKKYVGKTTKSFNLRLNGHVCESRKSKPKHYIHRSIKKHGIINFEMAIKYYPIEILDEKEKEYIKKLKTRFPDGYNLTDGGDGVSGLEYTKEIREKMSESHMGNKGFWENKKRSDKTKEKIRKSLTGKKHSLITKRKMAKIHTGMKHTKESKLKMSLIQKQRIKDGIALIPTPIVQISKHIYHFENKNGTKYVTDNLNDFCGKYNISPSSARRITKYGITHKSWYGFRIKKEKVA